MFNKSQFIYVEHDSYSTGEYNASTTKRHKSRTIYHVLTIDVADQPKHSIYKQMYVTMTQTPVAQAKQKRNQHLCERMKWINTIITSRPDPLRMKSSLTKKSRSVVQNQPRVLLVKYSIDCCYQHVRRVQSMLSGGAAHKKILFSL